MNPLQIQMYIGKKIHQVPWKLLHVGDEVGYVSTTKNRNVTGIIIRLVSGPTESYYNQFSVAWDGPEGRISEYIHSDYNVICWLGHLIAEEIT